MAEKAQGVDVFCSLLNGFQLNNIKTSLQIFSNKCNPKVQDLKQRDPC